MPSPMGLLGHVRDPVHSHCCRARQCGTSDDHHGLLLDDHEIVRRGLRELPESIDDRLVVGESGLAQEAARRSQ